MHVYKAMSCCIGTSVPLLPRIHLYVWGIRIFQNNWWSSCIPSSPKCDLNEFEVQHPSEKYFWIWHIFVFSPRKHIWILHHSDRLHGWPPLPRGNPQEFPPLDCQPTYRCLRKRQDTRSTLQLWQWTSPSPLCKWVANCTYHMMNTSNYIIFEL